MPKFGRTSRVRLRTCHRELIILCENVIEHVDFSVVEGHRSKELQDQYFSEGKSFLKWPQSKHNKEPSMAVDIIPYPAGYNERAMLVLAGFVLRTVALLQYQGIITHKIRWGGDWDGDGDYDDNSLWDPWHFELVEH